MPRYFVELAFHGANYHGWQRQAGDLPTVQQVLEEAFAKTLGQKIILYGCGRTDAGVHASSYWAHFDWENELEWSLIHKLNHRLPSDIALYQIRKVEDNKHAQRDALYRRYVYLLDLKKHPFGAGRSARLDSLNLDFTKMEAVAALYAQANDFKAFCRHPEQYPSTHCRIDHCSLEFVESQLNGVPAGRQLMFSIQANRFLQNMVRLLVARMVDVGRGSMSIEEVEHALQSGDAPRHLRPAVSDGLYLVEVGYDF